MSFYILLWNYTDQGIQNVKESPKRADAFKSKLENAGGKRIQHIIRLVNMMEYQ